MVSAGVVNVCMYMCVCLYRDGKVSVKAERDIVGPRDAFGLCQRGQYVYVYVCMPVQRWKGRCEGQERHFVCNILMTWDPNTYILTDRKCAPTYAVWSRP